ncbi:MAG: hypothetical protein R3324_16990, partial [Halobacteriales archaeon]|nr:hypothetical protein [Halobacteriales archaeon]
DPVFTVQRFSRLWTENTRDYLAYASETDTLLIRFEDLVEDRATLSELETHLGCSVDASVLGQRVSGTDRRPDRETTVVERLAIERITGSVAETLGYEFV